MPSRGSGLRMPSLQYSDRFADDVARVTSAKVEARIYAALDTVEALAGSAPESCPTRYAKSSTGVFARSW